MTNLNGLTIKDLKDYIDNLHETDLSKPVFFTDDGFGFTQATKIAKWSGYPLALGTVH